MPNENKFEPGYTGDGFTHQEDEELGEQEACARAVEGANQIEGSDESYTHCIEAALNPAGKQVVRFEMGLGTAELVIAALDIVNPEDEQNTQYARCLADSIRARLEWIAAKGHTLTVA